MDSLCSSSSWHWASGRRTLLLIFPFVFLSPLSLGLKTNGKKRKGGWEWRNSLETLAGRLEGRETSGWFMLSVWLESAGAPYECRHAICVLWHSCFLHHLLGLSRWRNFPCGDSGWFNSVVCRLRGMWYQHQGFFWWKSCHFSLMICWLNWAAVPD